MIIFGSVSVLLFVGVSFIQVPRDLALMCNHSPGTSMSYHEEHRLEYGLPFAYVKRSVSDFECYLKGSQHDNRFPGNYDSHEINVIAFIADVVIWTGLTILAWQLIPKKRLGQK
jgi:hypothetical protein